MNPPGRNVEGEKNYIQSSEKNKEKRSAQIQRSKLAANATEESSSERSMASHDLSVPDERWGRQAFGDGISHHFVRAQWHEFEEAIQYEFTHIVLTNVNMTGELSADRICAHRNTSKVVFVQKTGFSLRKSKIGYFFT